MKKEYEMPLGILFGILYMVPLIHYNLVQLAHFFSNYNIYTQLHIPFCIGAMLISGLIIVLLRRSQIQQGRTMAKAFFGTSMFFTLIWWLYCCLSSIIITGKLF